MPDSTAGTGALCKGMGMIEQRDLEAIGTAARAVAAVMRGATLPDLRLPEPASPSGDFPGEGTSDGGAPYESGVWDAGEPSTPPAEAIWVRQTPFDLWFVTFAGVWAEALHRWRHSVPSDVASPTADDAAVLQLTEEEWCARMREVRGPGGAGFTEDQVRDLFRQVTVSWERDLSQRWTAIQAFAGILARGETLPDWMVRQRVGVTSRWRFEEATSRQD